MIYYYVSFLTPAFVFISFFSPPLPMFYKNSHIVVNICSHILAYYIYRDMELYIIIYISTYYTYI